MLLRKQAVTVNRFRNVGAIGHAAASRQAEASSYVALACVLGLTAIAVAPLTPAGEAAGDVIASYVDLGFLHRGRQQVASAAAGLIGASGGPAARSGPVERHEFDLSSVRTIVASLHQQTIGLSAPFSISVPGAEASAPSKENALEPPQFFRQIARAAPASEVDFTPTATTGSITEERLPPLAYAMAQAKRNRLEARKEIAAVAKLRKSGAGKAEFSAAPAILGGERPGPPPVVKRLGQD